MEYHLVTVVWGRSFTDAYLKVVLPLQLCPGNLEAFKDEKALYRIFTTCEDREYICKSSVYHKLINTIQVDFIKISLHEELDSIARMTACHRMAVEDASKVNAALIFLSPDCLISNQCFRCLIHEINQGRRVVMVPSVRLQKEEMVPLLENLLVQNELKKNGILSRQLVSIGLPFFHAISKSLFWDKMINCHPSHIYWKLDEYNILIRAFHLHPLLVWPEKSSSSVITSIDDGFVSSACPRQETWKVIDDSDEIAIFEISNRDRENGMMAMMKCRSWNIATWASIFAAPLHFSFVRKRLYMKTSDRTTSWARQERLSDREIGCVLFFSKVFSHSPIFKVYRFLTWFFCRLVIELKTFSFTKRITRKIAKNILFYFGYI